MSAKGKQGSSKHDHLVTRSLLARFADKADQIELTELTPSGICKVIGIGDAMVRSHFLDIDVPGLARDAMEAYFGQSVEGPGIEAIRDLVAGGQALAQRLAIARFVALHLFRNDRARRDLFAAAVMAQDHQPNLPNDPEDRAIVLETRQIIWNRLSTFQGLNPAMAMLVEESAAYLAGLRWVIAAAQAPTFVTADIPVLIIDANGRRSGGDIQNGQWTHMWFPLDPLRALVIMAEGSAGPTNVSLITDAAAVSELLWHDAIRWGAGQLGVRAPDRKTSRSDSLNRVIAIGL